MKASVVIITKNRKDELRAAVLSALSQSVEPQVVVIDDGSTDGTAEMIALEFPSVCLVSHASSCGYIVRRNEAALLASGDVVFSIDDDAEFSSTRICETILTYFSDARIAAVAIPYREPYKDNVLLQCPRDRDRIWLTNSFIGTAHAIRRDVFLELGGYRESLIHQGEEDDFAIRLYDKGYFVSLGSSPEILHYESPKRDFGRMDYYGARNQLLWVWSYTPLALLPLLFIFRLISLVKFALSLGRQHRQFQGIGCSFAAIIRGWPRSPVSLESFILYFRLRRKSLALPSVSSWR
jgi:glycosyltransferase involved in cell wall biosynthesis